MVISNSNKFADDIIHRLNDKKDGFVCIENAIEEELISEIKLEIKEYLNKYGNPKYLCITNPLNKDLKSFKKLKNNTKIIDFLEHLTTKYLRFFFGAERVKNILKKDKIYSVLRYVSSSQTSMGFHYDKTLITVLVPILIPKFDIKKSGHLIAFPHSRKVRKFSFFNFLEKLLLQNNLTKKLFSLKTIKKDSIKIMKEGNIYIMNGYKTLHGNFPVDPSQQRITLLLHYGNPHVDSLILKTITFFTRGIKKLKGINV